MNLPLVVEVMEEPGLSNYFMTVMHGHQQYDADVVADFLLYTLTNLRNINGLSFRVDLDKGGKFYDRINPSIMQTIMDMIISDEISYSSGFEIIKLMFTSLDERSPREIVDYFGWHQITDPDEVERHCLELINNMKNIPKKYKKRGSMKDLRMMLDKLCQLTNNRISVRKAIACLDEILKPNKSN